MDLVLAKDFGPSFDSKWKTEPKRNAVEAAGVYQNQNPHNLLKIENQR